MAIKKKHLKAIREKALEVPHVGVKTFETHVVLGAVLIAQGVTETDGVPINPVQQYVHKFPVILGANHERRMRKIFKEKGNEGLLAYYDAVDLANGVAPPPREVARALCNMPPINAAGYIPHEKQTL